MRHAARRFSFSFGCCPAGLLRKSRAALGSERVRAALGSDGVRARAAGVTAGEDPTSFLGLGSLSGSTTTTTSALSRSWGRSRRPSVAESPRVPMNGIGRRTADGRGRRGGGAGGVAAPGGARDGAAFPAPLPKVPVLRALVERREIPFGPPLKLFTHDLTLEVANRCERAACSTRGALVSTWSPMRAAGG